MTSDQTILYCLSFPLSQNKGELVECPEQLQCHKLYLKVFEIRLKGLGLSVMFLVGDGRGLIL